MDSERLHDRVGLVEPGIRSVLDGYEIRFNKISKKTSSGRANIIPSEYACVEGALFSLTEEQFNILDKNEPGYHRQNINIKTDGGVVEATTYIADSDMVQDGLRPEKEYLSLVLKGAEENGLSDSYIKTFLR